ncbi:UNKNOWN [Stylonychia lemnae]|uniref:Uncharacterized protein n=1 Tax=Stylonychia lemnae TaxID=5949 RepID=A0A078B004_STYLE|nr:UNKNOWN [Stylonychia lemnae]|eukprot:CDW87829.1 UNKNOWN [Stylonychia lemnae]
MDALSLSPFSSFSLFSSLSNNIQTSNLIIKSTSTINTNLSDDNSQHSTDESIEEITDAEINELMIMDMVRHGFKSEVPKSPVAKSHNKKSQENTKMKSEVKKPVQLSLNSFFKPKATPSTKLTLPQQQQTSTRPFQQNNAKNSSEDYQLGDLGSRKIYPQEYDQVGIIGEGYLTRISFSYK